METFEYQELYELRWKFQSDPLKDNRGQTLMSKIVF